MIFTVWSRGDKITKECFDVNVSDNADPLEKYCAVAEYFKDKYAGKILLDVSDASIVTDLHCIEVQDDYRSESSGLRARIRYVYEWCKKAKDIRYPSVDAYVDVTSSSDIECKALAACVLDDIRCGGRCDVLDNLISFSLYYVQRVGN